MSDIQDITSVVQSASSLLDDIRGGAIARMKAQHEESMQQFGTGRQGALSAFGTEKDQAINAFNQEKAAKLSQADSELAGRRAAVDAVLGDLAGHTIRSTHYYDGVLHTKASIGIKADAADNTVSEWIKVPYPSDQLGCLSYSNQNALTMLYLKRAYSYDGGYPEYTTDKSRTSYQFIVANEVATSELINQEIISRNLEVKRYGGWNNCSVSGEIHTLQIGSLHGYKCLWVRAVNIPYRDGETPQNIEQFGGNAAFAVDKVINYPRIAK